MEEHRVSTRRRTLKEGKAHPVRFDGHGLPHPRPERGRRAPRIRRAHEATEGVPAPHRLLQYGHPGRAGLAARQTVGVYFTGPEEAAPARQV